MLTIVLPLSQVLSGEGGATARPEGERRTEHQHQDQEEEEEEEEEEEQVVDHRPSGIAGLIQSALQVLGGGGWSAHNIPGTVPSSTSVTQSYPVY